MRKFKNIRATLSAGRAGPAAPARRRALAALAAAALALGAGRAGRAGRARAEQPEAGGVLAEAFTWVERPKLAPPTPIALADGSEITLEAFRGRVVLLNFWATWCAPCVEEMPSLDRLQAKLRDEGLEVVAVSEDFGGVEQVAPFFESHALDHLTIYLDTGGALAKAFGIAGLPTTLLIDREGRAVGGLEGPAEWDSEDAVALVRHYLEHPEKV